MARRVGSGLALMAGIVLAIAPAAGADVTGVEIDKQAPIVGDTLTATLLGVADSAPAYGWFRCADETPASCDSPIDLATAPTYMVDAEDAGFHLGVRVTTTNPGGEQPAVHWDVTTGTVSAPPTVTTPTIGGQAIVGHTLTANVSATGVPTPNLTYEWRRCAPGSPPGECVPVGSAKDYAVDAQDAGAVLIVRATATNSAGAATSAWTGSAAVQEPPRIASVTITGQAVVGEKLTASADATGIPAPGLTYQWLRCAALLPLACEPIDDATAKGYVVASADVGDRVAVVVTAANSAGSATRTSEPTDVVQQPVRFDQSAPGSSPPSTDPVPSGSTVLRYLRPFPVVRVKGFLVPRGARFSLVRVRAPRESKVTVRCSKQACALPRRALRAGRIRALERRFPVGAKITIRVRKPGLIGKYVRIVIRDGTPPKRRDACLLPGDSRPVACPAP